MKRTKELTLSFAFVLTLLLLAALVSPPVSGSRKLTAAEAKNHIGEEATVCGVVASTRYAASSGGQPTFLNLGKPYPNQIFTVVIWGRNRAKFGTPELDYKDKRICVTGTIDEYRGVPQIEATNPSQLKPEKEPKEK